ncbi:hypothetical protein BHE74_00009812 [Ensete ventricosum]|nr:hypothetical protein BHE74_00009812 [Ensete ventricosum]RZS23824.1 hypothetical protein BHM03_00056816 [Ensete ventricosum]
MDYRPCQEMSQWLWVAAKGALLEGPNMLCNVGVAGRRASTILVRANEDVVRVLLQGLKDHVREEFRMQRVATRQRRGEATVDRGSGSGRGNDDGG